MHCMEYVVLQSWEWNVRSHAFRDTSPSSQEHFAEGCTLLETVDFRYCLRQPGVDVEESELVPLLLSFPLRGIVLQQTLYLFHEHVLQLTSWQVSMVAAQAYNSEPNAMAPRHMSQTPVGLGRQ